MKRARTLFALVAVLLATPAFATGGSGSATSDKGAANAANVSTHPCPSRADHQGKLRCACASMKGTREKSTNWSVDPERVPDYGG